MEFDYPLPERWKWVPLGELADPKGRAIVSGPFGSNISSKFFVEDGIPVIRGNNLTTGSQKFVDAGFVFVTPEKAKELGNVDAIRDDIIFTAAGSLGQVGVIPERTRFPAYIISNKQMRVRLNRELIDPLFAFQWLSSSPMVEFIQRQNTGSSVPLINLSIVRRLPVPLPPLPEQKAIAAVLGALDDKIELNRRMNATLESMARALFQSWFVDFDPVRAKLDRRQPTDMDTETAALFPDSFEHLGGELVPDGWRLLTMADVLSDDRGISVGVMYPGEHDPCGVPLIKAGDMNGGKINRNPPFRISQQKHAEYSRTEFAGGEILMTLVGNIGQCAVVPPEMKGWNSARAVAVIRLANATNANYVRLWLESPPIQFLMHAWSNTTVQETLNLKEIRKLPLLWPSQNVLEAFSKTVSPWFEQLENNYLQSETLANLRDTLLPKLLSGELSVASVEHQVPEISWT